MPRILQPCPYCGLPSSDAACRCHLDLLDNEPYSTAMIAELEADVTAAGLSLTPSIHAGSYVWWTTDPVKAELARQIEGMRVLRVPGSRFSQPVPGFECSIPVRPTEAELSAEGTGS